jgi:hypothetical protein
VQRVSTFPRRMWITAAVPPSIYPRCVVVDAEHTV